MTDLLPCPFCGGRAAWKQGIYTGYVMCLGCEVMGPNIIRLEAVAAWNLRAATASPLGAPTGSMTPPKPLPETPAWQPIESAPKDGTEIIFVNKYGHCSDVVHWRAPYEKLGLVFPGRFETKGGHSTGMNDDTAWSFWSLSPLPEPPQ